LVKKTYKGGKMKKNLCNKERKVDDPYEVWEMGTGDEKWTLHVLKKWQVDDDKPYGRWFTAVKSPMTYGSWEYGDQYVSEIKEHYTRVK
tara:strand:- start:1240 stop:1506 length:267 start_codon:yes stop_codon:yes gene_type:complete